MSGLQSSEVFQPMSNSISTEAEQMHSNLPDDVDASVEEIEDKIETLTGDFDVPLEEATRTVERTLLTEAGIDPDEHTPGRPDVVDAASIDSPDEWVTLEVEVVDLWDDTHESIAQTGLLADESGTIKFTLWESVADSLPTLVEGETYRLASVVTDEYQGQYSVNVVRTSEVSRIDEDIDTEQAQASVVSGSVVDIQSKSGLIKRCGYDDCTRTLQNGRCADHGAVGGSLDLRIKAVLDDGTDTKQLIFDAEQTAALTGISLEEAKAMATDALDRSVVSTRFEEMLVGRSLEAEVEQLGQYHLVQDATIQASVPDPGAVLRRGRSLAVTDDRVGDAHA